MNTFQTLGDRKQQLPGWSTAFVRLTQRYWLKWKRRKWDGLFVTVNIPEKQWLMRVECCTLMRLLRNTPSKIRPSKVRTAFVYGSRPRTGLNRREKMQWNRDPGTPLGSRNFSIGSKPPRVVKTNENVFRLIVLLSFRWTSAEFIYTYRISLVVVKKMSRTPVTRGLDLIDRT